MTIPDYAASLIHCLEQNGYEAFVVGGCVRDMLMGRVPDDYDITTNATPEQIKSCFSDYKTILTGEKHGTVCVVSEGNNIEITTYRVDGEYKDGRHPENVQFTTSLTDDLSRRDFTVNAMAYAPEHGLIDPFGGKSDLEKKIIRCVGEPAKRFGEDALRILRAVRFSAVLGFCIDKETERAVRSMKNEISKISAERIFTEICKLLCGMGAGDVMRAFPEVICAVIPELSACVGFDQKNKHHCYDVYTHTSYVVDNCPTDLYLRLAALFHDAGKPDKYFMGDDGQGHFYGHAERSEELAFQALTRLKSSGEIRKNVCELVRVHDREIVNTKKAVRRFLSVVSPETAVRIFDLKKADNFSLAPEYRSRVTELQKTEATLKEVIENGDCVSELQLEIGGDDLIKLGMVPGKKLGEMKKNILAAVMDGVVENEKNSLVAYAKTIIHTDN